jgi:zinc transporter, ZIP family
VEVTTESVLVAFGLTLFAGLATGAGSAIAFFTKRTNTRFLSGSLGFSAGVMIYVSFLEIFPKALEALSTVHGEKAGHWWATIAFFVGMLGTALIDKLVPSFENPHEARTVEDMADLPAEGPLHPSCEASTATVLATTTSDPVMTMNKAAESPGFIQTIPPVAGQPGSGRSPQELMRMGVFSALAIGIHNFPEGLATFVAALKDPKIGLSIAIAIAIHNIPEGIAVSVPIYHATGSRRKAFALSFLSGLAEPIGALVGYFLLFRYFDDTVFGILFGIVAGIMVFISLDELLPTAEKYGEHHLAMYGVVSGMMVMAVSLLLLA